MMRLYDYNTRRHLATIDACQLGAWCREHDYLPHHSYTAGTRTAFIVIKKGL